MTNPTQRQDLLPCPFCGGKARYFTQGADGFATVCCADEFGSYQERNCHFAYHNMSKDRWNTRAHPENTQPQTADKQDAERYLEILITALKIGTDHTLTLETIALAGDCIRAALTPQPQIDVEELDKDIKEDYKLLFELIDGASLKFLPNPHMDALKRLVEAAQGNLIASLRTALDMELLQEAKAIKEGGEFLGHEESEKLISDILAAPENTPPQIITGKTFVGPNPPSGHLNHLYSEPQIDVEPPESGWQRLLDEGSAIIDRESEFKKSLITSTLKRSPVDIEEIEDYDKGWNDCIDHLASRNLLRTAPENTGEELRTLKNLLITYQEVLGFYADEKNWIGQWHHECNQPVSSIDFDKGSRARAVLTNQKGKR